MPSKKHKPEEIIGKLREVEIVLGHGGTTAEGCRRIGVTEQTYYRWRKEYGGLKVDQARRMKDLKKENLRIRGAISDATLDKLILRDPMHSLKSRMRSARLPTQFSGRRTFRKAPKLAIPASSCRF